MSARADGSLKINKLSRSPVMTKDKLQQVRDEHLLKCNLHPPAVQGDHLIGWIDFK